MQGAKEHKGEKWEIAEKVRLGKHGWGFSSLGLGLGLGFGEKEAFESMI